MSRRDKQRELSRAIEGGQLWRAKEILSGRIGTFGFDAEMYEHFGALLLRMGDDVQAGRFLFLSGKRRPEYQAAIDLFLRKHVRGGRGDMFAAFPAQLRRRQWVDLPAQVQKELEALRFGPPSEGGALWAKLRFPKDQSFSSVGCLLALLVVAGFACLLSLFIVHFFY